MSDLYTPFVNSKRTICEIHRQILKVVKGTRIEDRVTPLLEEAYNMGKRMNDKLRQYKMNYDDGWYEENKNVESLIESIEYGLIRKE